MFSKKEFKNIQVTTYHLFNFWSKTFWTNVHAIIYSSSYIIFL